MSTAISSVANILDSVKFTASGSSFVGYTEGSAGTLLSDAGITYAKHLTIDTGYQGRFVALTATTSGLVQLRIVHKYASSEYIPPNASTGILYSDPTVSFNYMVIKNSSGVEIAELEMMAGVENNSFFNGDLSRVIFWFDNNWLGGGIQDFDFHAVEVTVTDSDTFTIPLTITKRGKAVPSGASETYTNSSGRVYADAVTRNSTSGIDISSASLSSNVVTINTSSGHSLTTGDKVDIADLGFSTYNPNTFAIPDLSGGYEGSALFVDGQTYTVELRNR